MKKTILLLSLIFNFTYANNPFSTLNLGNASILNKKSQFFDSVKSYADKGNAQAQFDLAQLYLKGSGIKKNTKLAFKWIHKSARNNHTEAKFHMGLNFLEGRGVLKMKHLALYWFKLAAKDGHIEAINYFNHYDKRV